MALEDCDIDVRKLAAKALGKIGDAHAVKQLIAKLKDGRSYLDVEKAAAKALEEIGDPAIEPLVAVLENSGYRAQIYAANILVKIGDARAIRPLIVWSSIALEASDSDVLVIEEVARILVRIRDVRAIAPLIAAFSRTKNGYEYSDAQAIVRSLEQILVAKAAEITIKDLSEMAALQDRWYDLTNYDEICWSRQGGSKVVSCSRVVQLARQELMRRGLKA